MKKPMALTAVIATSVLMTACAHLPFGHKDKQKLPKKLDMPNPASEYCLQQGGKLKRLKDAYGNSFNNCKLPHGKEQNEWDLYRSTHQ
ncbi:MAG: DUF333 domain-containing protein [Acinetobacter sp.]